MASISHEALIPSPDARVLLGSPILAVAGVGLKPEHYDDILRDQREAGGCGVGWFEVHAENYMDDGGPPHHYLAAVRELFPISVHGVGLSIGADAPLDTEHIARLRRVCERYRPGLVSEHLAWSSHDGTYFNDLLPLPYTTGTLDRVCEHVEEVQQALGRRILLENPSTYVRFASSDMGEIEFLERVVARTGCGLLLDVNNVFVSATNHGFDAADYIDSFPLAYVGEIHLGGHTGDSDDTGASLLIDSHGTPVADPVWSLLERIVARTGAVPTLIEWDNDVPPWPVIREEARRADRILAAAGGHRADALGVAIV